MDIITYQEGWNRDPECEGPSLTSMLVDGFFYGAYTFFKHYELYRETLAISQ